MGAILDDLYDHEGYGARRLLDGTITAGWSAETAEFDAYVVACSCGWHGGNHPPTDEGYEAAVDEWEADHARPLLAGTVPAAVTRAIADARQAIAALARHRPVAALRVVDELSEWAAAMRHRLDPPSAAARMRSRLDSLSTWERGRTLGR